jgi:hypothetical protein
MTSALLCGDRVTWQPQPGCTVSGVVAAVRGDGLIEVERGAERWLLRSAELRRAAP